jgi:hypothetical protein
VSASTTFEFFNLNGGPAKEDRRYAATLLKYLAEQMRDGKPYRIAPGWWDIIHAIVEYDHQQEAAAKGA